MRKQTTYILILLLTAFFACSELAARPDMFMADQYQNNRFWRLSQALTQLDNSGSWTNHKLDRHYYNPLVPALADSTCSNMFDPDLGWITCNIDCFSYIPNQPYITQVLSKLVIFDQAIPFMRGLFEYNNLYQITSARVQILEMDLQRQWEDVKRAYVLYNNGNLSQIVTWYVGDDENPGGYNRYDFQVDRTGRITQQTEYVSDDSLNWITAYRTTFTYHPNDTTNGWTLVENISQKFPHYLLYEQPMPLGMLTESLREIWMYQYWRNDTRDVFAYDNSDRLFIHQNYYSDMLGNWQNNLLHTFTYDVNGNLVNDLLQVWNPDSTTWQNQQLITNTWEQTTASDDELCPDLAGLELVAYPNPFCAGLNIRVNSQSKAPVRISLYNAKGQKLYSETLPANALKSLEADKLSGCMSGSGVYLLKAEQGAAKVSRKLLRLN
jgi:hypothetical protein